MPKPKSGESVNSPGEESPRASEEGTPLPAESKETPPPAASALRRGLPRDWPFTKHGMPRSPGVYNYVDKDE